MLLHGNTSKVDKYKNTNFFFTCIFTHTLLNLGQDNTNIVDYFFFIPMIVFVVLKTFICMRHIILQLFLEARLESERDAEREAVRKKEINT